MVTDRQVRLLMKVLQEEKTLSVASAKAGMDEKTARRYRELRKTPSEVKREHTWRTRKDPFSEVWEDVRSKLDLNAGLDAYSRASRPLIPDEAGHPFRLIPATDSD